jgi:hypothetical protein
MHAALWLVNVGCWQVCSVLVLHQVVSDAATD